MTPYNKKIARNALLGGGLPALFVLSGWVFLSTIEGWFGVLLWVLVSVPICFVVEVVLRPKATTFRSAKSLPRMQVRAPVRGDPERSQPTTRSSRDPEFRWHREESAAQRRRRSYAGR